MNFFDTFVIYLMVLPLGGMGVSCQIIIVPRAPDEEDQSAAGLLLRTYSAGPVSPICFTDLKGPELTTHSNPR